MTNVAVRTHVEEIDVIEQYEDIDIDRIVVGPRFRKDMGDIDGLATSIREIGLLQPLVVANDNTLVDGGRRIAAFRQLHWTRIPVRRVNLTDIIRGEHDANEVRKDFTPSERVAIAEALRVKMGERRGTNQHTKEDAQNFGHPVGVRTANIVAERAGFGNAETYRQAKSVVEKGVPELVEAMDRGDVAISAAATIAKQPHDVQRAHVAGNDNKSTRLASYSGDNEWYTPARYVELAREVMGGIDVDPASNDHAQKTVRAGIYYTAETNGLDKEWHGRVWMNPPYSNPEVQQFAAKVIEEFNAGRCTEAIVLTNNAADTAWHRTMQDACTRYCTTTGRIRFESLTRDGNSPAMGQSFFYFGDDPERFKDIFSSAGKVWVAA